MILLLCSYYDNTKILLYINIPVSSLIFSLRNVGKFQFFLCVFAEKMKNDTGGKKKGKKFFLQKKLTREILFNTSSHTPIYTIHNI